MPKPSKILDLLFPRRVFEREVLARLTGIETQETKIMATQVELAEELRKAKAQAIKIATEQGLRFDALSAQIAKLEAIIRDGTVSPEVEAELAALKVELQKLDDSIPDVPTPG